MIVNIYSTQPTGVMLKRGEGMNPAPGVSQEVRVLGETSLWIAYASCPSRCPIRSIARAKGGEKARAGIVVSDEKQSRQTHSCVFGPF